MTAYNSDCARRDSTELPETTPELEAVDQPCIGTGPDFASVPFGL